MDNKSTAEPQKSKKILKTVAIVVGIIVVLTIIGLVIYFITKKSSSVAVLQRRLRET